MVTLVIMDGLGINKSKFGNACYDNMPMFNKLKKQYPYTQLKASGEFVGLPGGVMGNSEVGHLNLGAGRVVYQDLLRINNEIENENFYKNQSINQAINHVKQNQSTLHVMGLCSDGAVHSHIEHLKAILKMAIESDVKNVILHLFLDGRDTGVKSGVNFVTKIDKYIQNTNIKIGSLCGRVYAMDREQRFDRIQKAYDLLVFGKSQNQTLDYDQAFMQSYGENVTDEFFEPTKLNDFKQIQDGDAVVFFNFRSDRARELTCAFTQKNFDKFKVKTFKNLCFVCMTEYDSNFQNVLVAYPPYKISDGLSSQISKAGLKQFHISETTKYAHVTFFFNGGIEKPYKNENRKLIESENILSFAETPNMKAFEICEEALLAITEKKYDFILVNLSNADMLGHTGDFDQTVKAVQAVDKCAYAIALATLMAGGDCIITADHGNAEEMLAKNGEKITTHTTNPVPFLLVSQKYQNSKLKKEGALCNVAPTILYLLQIKKPKTMSDDLFAKKITTDIK